MKQFLYTWNKVVTPFIPVIHALGYIAEKKGHTYSFTMSHEALKIGSPRPAVPQLTAAPRLLPTRVLYSI
jgi:hypothetical protein